MRGLWVSVPQVDTSAVSSHILADGAEVGWDLNASHCPPGQRLTRELDLCYRTTGSLFRCGFRQTLFSNQLMRYADLYTATCLNFLHYPLSSLFRAVPELVGPCTNLEKELSEPHPC